MRGLPVWIALLGLVLAAGCGVARQIRTAPDSAAPSAKQQLPVLSQLDALSKHVSDVSIIKGADAIATSGPPSAYPHPTQGSWLVLDGDLAPTGQFAWAVWRVALTADQLPDYFDMTLPNNGLKRYWVAYANFAKQRWDFVTDNTNEFGLQGATYHLEPTSPGDVLSPARNVYVAVISRPGQSPNSQINISSIDATYHLNTSGDPIFDDFENNDQLEDAYPLPGAGTYHASIHETYRSDMSNPAEFIDKYDYYSLTIPAGKQLTVTLRHEPHNHFAIDPPPVDYTDLDLYFYNGGETDEQKFVEANSSFQVYYGLEQIHLTGLSGPFELGIVPDLGDNYDDNAEYDLGVFFSDSTYSVSGKVTQNGAPVTVRFGVFLEPGNFNVPTNFDSGHEGEFTIPGVPNGSYTLKVQGSAGFYQTGYVYTTTLPVTVNNGNVSGANIDIEPYGGP